MELLNIARKQFKELRLCQLIYVACWKTNIKSDDLFYVEDETLKSGLIKLLTEYKGERHD